MNLRHNTCRGDEIKIICHDFPSTVNEIKLLVLSDLHIGDALVDTKRLSQFLIEAAEEDTYVIINGDIINNAIINSVSNVYNDIYTPKQQIDIISDILMPIRHKILVICEGNHEIRTAKLTNINLMEEVAHRIYDKATVNKIYSNEPYLLYIAFGMNQGRAERKTVYSLYGKHGMGGGKRVGSKMNHLEDMLSIINADIFVVGHTHVPASFRLVSNSVDYRNRKVTPKEHVFVNANAFLNYGGYGEDMGFRPTSTIYPKMFLSGFDRDVRVLI